MLDSAAGQWSAAPGHSHESTLGQAGGVREEGGGGGILGYRDRPRTAEAARGRRGLGRERGARPGRTDRSPGRTPTQLRGVGMEGGGSLDLIRGRAAVWLRWGRAPRQAGERAPNRVSVPQPQGPNTLQPLRPGRETASPSSPRSACQSLRKHRGRPDIRDVPSRSAVSSRGGA